MDFSIGVLVGMQGSMNTAFSFFLLEERETAAALEKIEDFLVVAYSVPFPPTRFSL